MRKFLTVFGAIALAVVVLAAIGIGYAAWRGSALDRESKTFVDEAVPAISARWDKQQLLDRATPELRAAASPEQIATLFATLSRLGPLIEYRGAKGDANMAWTAGSGSVTSATYVATAHFQNGNASFRIVLLKRDGHWMIHNFHVDPAPPDSPPKRT